MTRNRIVARAVLTTGLAVSASLAMALPAQAHGDRPADVTCNATIGAQTVRNVVVADGTACVLDGTTVKGGITVGAGAALDLSNVKVYKSLTSTGSGRVTGLGSMVFGGVSTTDTGIVRFTDSGVVGDVTATGGTTSFSASGLGVGGDLSGTSVARFDVSASYVAGSLTATQAFSGSSLCGNKVYGNTRVASSGGGIRLGGSDTCAGNKVRGSVLVESNRASIAIDGNTIYGDLNCVTNRPTPVVGPNNTVNGARLGQCA